MIQILKKTDRVNGTVQDYIQFYYHNQYKNIDNRKIVWEFYSYILKFTFVYGLSACEISHISLIRMMYIRMSL